MEEAKAQEISKLQASLQDMQLQVQAASDSLIQEREQNKMALGQAVLAAERVPSVEVTDAKVEKLVAECDRLKVRLSVRLCLSVFCHHRSLFPLWSSLGWSRKVRMAYLPVLITFCELEKRGIFVEHLYRCYVLQVLRDLRGLRLGLGRDT